MGRFIDNVERYVISPNDLINVAIRCIDAGAIGICLVLDDSSRLISTITDGDVRRAMLAGIGFDESVVRLLELKEKRTDRRIPVTRPVAMADDLLLTTMKSEDVQHIPLLDDLGRVVDVALLGKLISSNVLPVISAVIMAGGFGSRLRPLTETVPKPMLPVGGKPLLERIINQLQSSGVHNVSITTHYLPDKIVEHFGGGQDFGVNLSYVHEEQPLGTAGSLGLLDPPQDTILVINGDILTNIDFRSMANFHRSHDAALTIAVRHYEVSVPYGVVISDGERVSEVREKPRLDFFINAGIYLMEPRVWPFISRGEHLDMPRLIERLIETGATVISFPLREYWLDVGRHNDYEQAETDIQNGKLDE